VAIIYLLGTFQGALDTGCNTLLTWIHGSKGSPYMNGLHFFFGVGSFLAPLIFARVVMIGNDISWAFWFFSLLAVPVAIWLWFLPSPSVRRNTAVTSGGRFNYGPFLLIVLFFVFAVGLELGFGNWIYTYSYRLQLVSKIDAAYLTSAFWGVFTLGRLIGIPISSRFRLSAILLTDMGGCLAAFAILLVWPDSSAALWVGTILMGLSIASTFATGLSFAEQQMTLTGTMIGWILVGGGIGGMIFPWLIGQLFEKFSPHMTMSVLLAGNIIAFGLLLVIILPRRRKELANL
jgi:FHS family Na+ dependent glucose MFS transporter 1